TCCLIAFRTCCRELPTGLEPGATRLADQPLLDLPGVLGEQVAGAAQHGGPVGGLRRGPRPLRTGRGGGRSPDLIGVGDTDPAELRAGGGLERRLVARRSGDPATAVDVAGPAA